MRMHSGIFSRLQKVAASAAPVAAPKPAAKPAAAAGAPPSIAKKAPPVSQVVNEPWGPEADRLGAAGERSLQEATARDKANRQAEAAAARARITPEQQAQARRWAADHVKAFGDAVGTDIYGRPLPSGGYTPEMVEEHMKAMGDKLYDHPWFH